ncbi:MAG: hypothetical protein LBR69_03250 [Endomicrobium sp.]|jgi:hypothetical protein|nr:hypothetical protein [Endomicrobium sp.]
MKKILITLSLLIVSSTISFAADNIGRNVYSIYSENFNGVKINWLISPYYDQASLDNCMIWVGWGAAAAAVPAFVSTDALPGAFEGSYYWRLTSTAGNGSYWGNGVQFVSGVGGGSPGNVNMSDYYGGTIEFYFRPDNLTICNNLSVGITDVAASNDRLYTLSSLATSTIQLNEWNKAVIKLDGSRSITSTYLSSILYCFMYSASLTTVGTVDFDQIVWKKASGNMTNNSFSVTAKNISNDAVASSITWNSSEITAGDRWFAAEQYLQIDLDYLESDNWKVLVYTNDSAVYTGSETGYSGLINMADTSKKIPMSWRATNKVLTSTGDPSYIIGIEDNEPADFYAVGPDGKKWKCWFFMRDLSHFQLLDEENIRVQDNDSVVVWDKRGFHGAPGQTWYANAAADWPNGFISPRIYLAADFGTATAGEYKTENLVVELILDE